MHLYDYILTNLIIFDLPFLGSLKILHLPLQNVFTTNEKAIPENHDSAFVVRNAGTVVVLLQLSTAWEGTQGGSSLDCQVQKFCSFCLLKPLSLALLQVLAPKIWVLDTWCSKIHKCQPPKLPPKPNFSLANDLWIDSKTQNSLGKDGEGLTKKVTRHTEVSGQVTQEGGAGSQPG